MLKQNLFVREKNRVYMQSVPPETQLNLLIWYISYMGGTQQTFRNTTAEFLQKVGPFHKGVQKDTDKRLMQVNIKCFILHTFSKYKAQGIFHLWHMDSKYTGMRIRLTFHLIIAYLKSQKNMDIPRWGSLTVEHMDR